VTTILAERQYAIAMIVVRLLIGLAGALGVLVVLSSAVRSVVLPRAFPARLARVAFLAVRLPVAALAARYARRGAWRRRDELLSLQGPLGILAQLATWTLLVAAGFTAVLWAVDGNAASPAGVSAAARESGSALSTLGIVRPAHAAGEYLAFAEAGVGLVLLALVVTYLPTIYGAFSRREAVVAKLTIRAGAPPTPTGLLLRSWELGRFDRLEEVWQSWQEWFIDVGESHTSFPQLTFFRSSRSHTSWVTAAETMLDAAVLARHALDVAPDSRSELTVLAGVGALELIGDYFGIPPTDEDGSGLDRGVFEQALTELAEAGLPVVKDREGAWRSFADERRRYETLLFTIAGLADAVPTPWLPAERFGRHRPPVLRPGLVRRGSAEGP
jgi:hypothetical protein